MGLEYSIDALKRGIEQCNKNIEIFENAIEKEMQTKKEYRDKIAFLEQQNNILEEVKKHIQIDNG